MKTRSLFTALVMLGLFLFSCTPANRSDQAQYQVKSKKEVRVEPPRAVKPPPPPPPPVIKDVPQEEIEELTENIVFYDKAAEPEMNTEEYNLIKENSFNNALRTPLSTLSIDVDNASYSNVRRHLMQGHLPPVDAVRIEEMINYFTYDYETPDGEHPFSVTTEVATCPWNTKNRLVHIGLRGADIPEDDTPPSNLVFLLDVSGSMNQANKLPLLKNAFKMLIKQLNNEDRVAIVVYAGASGVVLPSTPGSEKYQMRLALDQLTAGGSTAGAEGIQLAYKIAKNNFIKDGNNRVILATDGDFNVGVSSQSELVKLIEKKREEGVFLSVLGFGTGNYKDSRMEQIADNGNGNYAYIDNINEARKVLVTEMKSNIYTVAKDVKLQIEFNPAQVKEYRLIGYENRLLNDEDFNDDKKDAGDMGPGHTVTAIYEVVPAGSESTASASIDPLKYQEQHVKASAKNDPDLMTIKLRYKKPDEQKSSLFQLATRDNDKSLDDASENFRFASAVASFGMVLRNSAHKGAANYDNVEELARGAIGLDKEGYRKEFLTLIELSRSMDERGNGELSAEN